VTPIADMLHAMLWGVGLHAGFIDSQVDLGLITKQLTRLLSHGLLDSTSAGASVGPNTAFAVSATDFGQRPRDEGGVVDMTAVPFQKTS
jgi:hypothetical protein